MDLYTTVSYFNSDSNACLSPNREANGADVCYWHSWRQNEPNNTMKLVTWTFYNVTLIANRTKYRPTLYGPYPIYFGSHGMLQLFTSVFAN